MKYIFTFESKVSGFEGENLSNEVDLALLILTRAILKTSLLYGTELQKEEPM